MSDQIFVTVGSIVSHIEDKLSTLEVNIKDAITNIIEEMLRKFMSKDSANSSVGQEDLS